MKEASPATEASPGQTLESFKTNLDTLLNQVGIPKDGIRLKFVLDQQRLLHGKIRAALLVGRGHLNADMERATGAESLKRRSSNLIDGFAYIKKWGGEIGFDEREETMGNIKARTDAERELQKLLATLFDGANINTEAIDYLREKISEAKKNRANVVARVRQAVDDLINTEDLPSNVAAQLATDLGVYAKTVHGQWVREKGNDGRVVESLRSTGRWIARLIGDKDGQLEMQAVIDGQVICEVFKKGQRDRAKERIYRELSKCGYTIVGCDEGGQKQK